MTGQGEVLLRQWLTREAGWRYGIMSTVPYEQQKIIQTNILIITREAGWRYGIMSTVPYKKLYRQIILLLHGRPVGAMVSCLRFLIKNYTDK